MPFRRFSPLLLAALAAGAQATAVRNGDFGAGLAEWEARIAAGEPGAVSLDAGTSQDANGALRIAQRNPRSRTSLVQTVAVLPRQEYVATAWLKGRDVVRRGIGAHLLVADSDGRILARAIPASPRQGSFGWVPVSVRFASGPRTSVALGPALHEASGTVWFDDVALLPAPPWHGPPGPPSDLPPPAVLPPAEICDYQNLRQDVTTPHWAFGKPLARRLRVAVLAPALAQRETVELAQRLDCEAVPLMVHSGDSLGTVGAGRGTLTHDAALANLRDKLREDYDVLVIARVAWEILTEEINRTIIEKARAGMGVVYVCPEGQRLSPDHPLFRIVPMPVAELAGTGLAGLPGFEALASREDFLARHVQPYSLDKGRMLVVDYGTAAPSDHHYLTPPTRRWRDGYAHYDLYMAFLGKAIRWAAAASPDLLLTRLAAPSQVQWGTPAALSFAVRGPVGAGLRAELAVRRLRPSAWDPPAETQVCQPADGETTLALPTRLPAGDYVALLVLRDGDSCLDWGWIRFAIRGPLAVAQLDLPDRTLPGSSASIPVAMRLEGEIPEGATLRFEVHDAYGRLAGRGEQALTTRVLRTDVSCAFSRSVYNCLSIHVVDGAGLPLLSQDAEFTIPKPRPDDAFHFVMAGDGGDDYIGALLRRQAARSGVDAATVSLGAPGTRRLTGDERRDLRERLMALAREGIAPVPQVHGLAPREETDAGTRQPCLTDPSFRAAFAEILDERVDLARPFSPPGISLGEESWLGQATEHCLSPTCRSHFRDGLRETYGDLDSLNQAWGTDLADFAEAMPLRRRELGGNGDWPRWLDWRRDMDRVFAEGQAFGQETARRTILAARVGCGRLLADTPSCGYDWERLGAACSLLGVRLDDPAQVHLLRSFGEPGALLGGWFGGDMAERSDPAWQRWAPWKLLFSGLNSAWFQAPYGPVGGDGEIGFRPDLSPYDCWSAAAGEIDRAKRGIDRLLLAAERDDGGIALVYSRSSALVSTLDPDCDDHLAALAAMGQLLADAGYSFRVIPESLLEGDGLRGACQAVFLPACVALSDEATEGLRKFAEEGGVVVADWMAGRYDQHGRQRVQGSIDGFFGLVRGEDLRFVVPPAGIPGLLPQTRLDASFRIRNAWAKRFVGSIPILIASTHGAGLAVYLNFSLIHYPQISGARGAGLQEWLRQTLARDGLAEPVPLKGQWGAPHRVETARWRRGDLRFVGLLKHPDTPQVGEDLELPLPKGLHAYDVLDGRYLGNGRKARFHMNPGEAKLISLDPERIRSVELERLEGDQYLTPAYRITVKAWRGAADSERVVHIRVFDPAGHLYPAGTATLSAPEGTCEYDVPFGLHAPVPGRWRVEAIDAATGIRHEVALAIRARK